VQPRNDAVVHEAAEYGLVQRMWGSAATRAASQACILAGTVSPGGVRGR
jgi:hypothetical protein